VLRLAISLYILRIISKGLFEAIYGLFGSTRFCISYSQRQIATTHMSETTRQILMKLESCNYCPKTYVHHAKLHTNLTTWVVSANS